MNLIKTLWAVGLTPLMFTDHTNHTFLLRALRDVESGSVYSAVSLDGSCRGAYQFNEVTWLGFDSSTPFCHLQDLPARIQDGWAELHLQRLVTKLMVAHRTVTVRRLASLWNTGSDQYTHSDYATRVENLYKEYCHEHK
jgi:hypothetical protein